MQHHSKHLPSLFIKEEFYGFSEIFHKKKRNYFSQKYYHHHFTAKMTIIFYSAIVIYFYINYLFFSNLNNDQIKSF